MGFINDFTSGMKKYKNTRGYTVTTLYDVLRNIPVSFGEAQMGKVKKDDAIIYVMDCGFLVYVTVDKKNITVMRIIDSDQQSVAGHVTKEIAISVLTEAVTDNVLGASGKGEREADHAVDELGDVIEQLLNTGRAESKVASVGGNTVKLYMKQKVIAIKDRYYVYDKDEKAVYEVEGNLIGLTFDVRKVGGQNLYTIKKKLIAIMPNYKLLQGDYEIGEIKKKIKLSRTEIVGHINGQDLLIKGDMRGFNFSIELGGKIIGLVDTERLTWGDCYAITVNDPSKEALVVTIAVICDNTLKGKSK